MDQEAASCVAVLRRERAVRRSEDRVRRAGDPEHRKGHGNNVWIESAPGRFSNNVLGQPQRSGQGKACRYAESVHTGGLQSRAIRHEEGRHERETSWQGQLMSIMVYEFLRTDVDSLEGRLTGA